MSWYIINLKRREDRKNEIIKRLQEANIYNYNIIEAIDGTESLPPTKNIIDNNNDFQSNPRIAATILSHRKVWKLIAESDQDYGIVAEDDIYFHPEFNKLWNRISPNIKYLKSHITYLGMGDVLPIHTNPPSLTLLKAQEKSHIVKNSLKYKYFGVPNVDSPYVFDWFGAFSYVISRDVAKQLLEFRNIDRGLDVWLKDSPVEKLVTVPLLTYHAAFDYNLYDSDTWGITRPIDDAEPKNRYTVNFLMVVYGDNSVEDLRNSLDSIVDGSKFIGDESYLSLSILYHIENDEITSLINEFKEKHNVSVYTIQENKVPNRYDGYEYYNKLCKFTVDVDFFVLWDINVLVSRNWDYYLYKYYETYNCPSIACFKLNTNTERNINVLNGGEGFTNISDFSTPIITGKLVKIIQHISPTSHVYDYIKYLSYLTCICIIVRDVSTMSIKRIKNEYMDKMISIFYNDPLVKDSMNHDINLIKKNSMYSTCGVWTKLPDGWNTTKTIGESKLNI